ncbi:MAG TPA: ROK family transcriptional regulator [Verrucomicrobiae bacterium]|nr:ROK family transcriptional regulator [Verrucomicrobiae bacterium]
MKLGVEQRAVVESEILKRVRAHPGISRVALSRKLQIAPSTVGVYVGRLVSHGFLAETQSVDSTPGRPPTALELNPNGGQFIGVDFEARSMTAMAVDFSANPLRQAHGEIEAGDSASVILKRIERLILDMLPGKKRRPLAIGIGAPGLVDPAKGVAVDYKYIKGWRNIALAAPLARRFGAPVYLENTIRSMALAELWFGQGRGVSDWVCLGIRSGIGAGIVAGGQLQRGAHYQAGEIGRWRCPWPEHPATRFFMGSGSARAADAELQEVASARALLAAWERAQNGDRKNGRPARLLDAEFSELVSEARRGDALTMQLIAVVAEVLGWAVAQLVLALNPSRVILAGRLTPLGDALLDPLQRRAREVLRACGAEMPAIMNSAMGEYIGAWGAAALALHEWKPACDRS